MKISKSHISLFILSFAFVGTNAWAQATINPVEFLGNHRTESETGATSGEKRKREAAGDPEKNVDMNSAQARLAIETADHLTCKSEVTAKAVNELYKGQSQTVVAILRDSLRDGIINYAKQYQDLIAKSGAKKVIAEPVLNADQFGRTMLAHIGDYYGNGKGKESITEMVGILQKVYADTFQSVVTDEFLEGLRERGLRVGRQSSKRGGPIDQKEIELKIAEHFGDFNKVDNIWSELQKSDEAKEKQANMCLIPAKDLKIPLKSPDPSAKNDDTKAKEESSASVVSENPEDLEKAIQEKSESVRAKEVERASSKSELDSAVVNGDADSPEVAEKFKIYKDAKDDLARQNKELADLEAKETTSLYKATEGTDIWSDLSPRAKQLVAKPELVTEAKVSADVKNAGEKAAEDRAALRQIEEATKNAKEAIRISKALGNRRANAIDLDIANEWNKYLSNARATDDTLKEIAQLRKTHKDKMPISLPNNTAALFKQFPTLAPELTRIFKTPEKIQAMLDHDERALKDLIFILSLEEPTLQQSEPTDNGQYK